MFLGNKTNTYGRKGGSYVLVESVSSDERSRRGTSYLTPTGSVFFPTRRGGFRVFASVESGSQCRWRRGQPNRPRRPSGCRLLSHDKIAHTFRTLFGIHLSRGGSAQIVLRAGQRLRPAYQEILEHLKQSEIITPDGTGWRIG